MWRMTRFAIVFYAVIVLVTSLAVILFELHVFLDIDTVKQILDFLYYDTKARGVVIIVALTILFVSKLLDDLIYGQRRRERNIVFENSGGPVAVSLTALEDLIRRISTQVPEVKEIRPTVLAIKKGLDIDIKLILRSEANIPDLTARLQDLVRRKIEDAIQMEGKINIRIHVVKIALDDVKDKRPVHIEEPHVPFHGYRA